MAHDPKSLDRRRFLKTTAAGIGATAAGASILGAAEKESTTKPAVDPEKLIWLSKNPEMKYERLGRTNFMCSKVVAGWGGDDALWRKMVANGVNYFDNALGYGNYEIDMKGWLKKYRKKIWLTSKATDVAGYSRIDEDVKKLYQAAMKTYLAADVYDGKKDNLLALHKAAVEKQKATGEKPDLRPAGKRMAELYSKKIDESLSRMGVDDVDCYMVHGIEIPWFFACTEVWDAYVKAHKAGKAKHFGFSVHAHHKEVLAAAVEADTTGPWKIDLIMPGVNPESFDTLKPELTALKKRDIGIVAMKTSGIKNRPLDGREKKFEKLLGDREFNEWERSKLWMLNLTEGLVDSVIAVMDNLDHMERTSGLAKVTLTAAAEKELRAIVKYEMAGACHLCGDCETHCPEHIAIADMIRYHAYVKQYDAKAMARDLYSKAGYDPARLCTSCGKCVDACKSNVRITDLLNELSTIMATT